VNVSHEINIAISYCNGAQASHCASQLQVLVVQDFSARKYIDLLFFFDTIPTMLLSIWPQRA
jgi:hypothetical protein